MLLKTEIQIWAKMMMGLIFFIKSSSTIKNDFFYGRLDTEHDLTKVLKLGSVQIWLLFIIFCVHLKFCLQ